MQSCTGGGTYWSRGHGLYAAGTELGATWLAVCSHDKMLCTADIRVLAGDESKCSSPSPLCARPVTPVGAGTRTHCVGSSMVYPVAARSTPAASASSGWWPSASSPASPSADPTAPATVSSRVLGRGGTGGLQHPRVCVKGAIPCLENCTAPPVPCGTIETSHVPHDSCGSPSRHSA